MKQKAQFCYFDAQLPMQPFKSASSKLNTLPFAQNHNTHKKEYAMQLRETILGWRILDYFSYRCNQCQFCVSFYLQEQNNYQTTAFCSNDH